MKQLTASFFVRPVRAIRIGVADPRERDAFTDAALAGKLFFGAFFYF